MRKQVSKNKKDNSKPSDVTDSQRKSANAISSSEKPCSIGKKKKKRKLKVVEGGSKESQGQVIKDVVKNYANEEVVKEKLMTSNDEEMGMCHMCQKPFTRQRNYHVHFDNPSLMEDSEQSQPSNSSSSPTVNSALVNDLMCQICGIEFPCKDALRAHCSSHLCGIFKAAARLKLIKKRKSATKRKVVKGSS